MGTGVQADVLTKMILPSSLFLIMLGIGMTLRLSNFKNIFNFLSLIVNKENSEIKLNWEDEIVNAVVLTDDGFVRLEQFK